MFFKKRLNKKGEISDMVLKVILDLMVVLFFATILSIYIHDSVKDTRFEKQFLARDISLLTNVVYSAPYDLVVSYSSDKPEFSYEFVNYNVDVYEEDKKDEENTSEKKDTNWEDYDVWDFSEYAGKTEYNKGSYRFAGDEKLQIRDTKIQEDYFEIKKGPTFVKVE